MTSFLGLFLWLGTSIITENRGSLFFYLKKLQKPCKYRFYKKIGVFYLTLPIKNGGEKDEKIMAL
jgi:hypothetical protein